MQGQKEVPPDMQCKDKFLLQSVVASLGATAKDITPEMFNKEAGHNVEECRLRAIYVAPPRPPSHVHEGSEEGSSPRASVSENENFTAPVFSAAARALISKLTEEKNAVIQQNHKLQQELEISRRQANRSSSGLPFIYFAIVGLIGIILGYLVKKI